MPSEMALHESANQIPWFATGRGGEHLDLNTSRDWRQEAEEGITEEDILAPLDNGEEQHKHKDKKHKSHGHHHKEHHKTKNSSAHSNRVSPGGGEALSPAPPPPYVPSLPDEADGKRPGRANFAIPVATEDWVREWEKRKKNAKSALDIGRYVTKKTLSKGMLDIALLASNASQFKYLMQVGEKHEYYNEMIGLVVSSIVLQVIVGILFFIIGMMDVNDDSSKSSSNTLNNIILILVFVITVINAFISGFGIKHTDTSVNQAMGTGKVS